MPEDLRGIFYRLGISIALIIHSLDRRWRFQRLVGNKRGNRRFSEGTLSHSLIARLILQKTTELCKK